MNQSVCKDLKWLDTHKEDNGGPTPFLYVAKYGEQPASLLDSEGQKRSEKIPLLYQEIMER